MNQTYIVGDIMFTAKKPPPVVEHRYQSWVDALREMGGIPVDAALNIMRDYGEVNGVDLRLGWTGGYIADWYVGVMRAGMQLVDEREVLVDNVPVTVRKWSLRGGVDG